MFGLGFSEILVLALLSGGMSSTDLVALVQPSHYFKSRQIDPTIDRMIDIVITDPKTPKAQILQLTALRHIADEAEKFKKAKNYATNRLAIGEIAQGKLAQDPQGFAQEYAKLALAKLDGTKPAAAKIRPLREDALAWFPADTRFAFAVELRQTQDAPNDTLKELLKLLPDATKREMYDQIEQLGNIRLERIAFGLVDAKKSDDQKLYIRITGKGNPAWLAGMLQTVPGGTFQTKKIKDADGTPILLLQDNNQGQAIMLIGNTDLMIAGYTGFNGKHEDVAREALDVRAKKKPNAGAGVLKDRLAKIPDKAIALVVGDLQDENKRLFGELIDPVPSKISGYIERTPMGLDVRAEATLTNAEESGKFLKKAGALRKEGIAALQKAMKEPLPPGTPPVPFQAIINLVESVQVQNQADKVQLRGFVPNTMIQQLGQMSIFYAAEGGLDPLPPAKGMK